MHNNNLSQQENFLQDISDRLISSIWIYDVENYRIFWANKAALALWQADSLEELISRDFKPDTSKAVQNTLLDYQRIFQQNKSISRMWQYAPKGVIKEAFCQMSGFIFDDGRMGLMCEALEPHLLGDKSSPNSVVLLSTYDLNGQFMSGNPPFLQAFSNENQNLDKLMVDDQLCQSLLKTIESTERYETELQVVTKSGPRWHRIIATLSSGLPSDLSSDLSSRHTAPRTILIQQFDVNESKLSELAFAKEAITDPLTGLLNRRGLDRKLQKLINLNEGFLIYYIDLDGFKMINDSLGHRVGDVILKALAQRLLDIKNATTMACRYGGDEFILVANTKDLLITSEELVNQLMCDLNEVYLNEFALNAESQSLRVSVSIGISRFPEDGHDISKLILRADAAMYSAKKQGKRRWVNYVQGMESGLQRQNDIAQHLFNALKHSSLMLYYQPIYNVDLNEIDSFEALLRWNDPTLGWVPPEEIIAVAEEIGIIADLEYWIIERALSDLIELRKLSTESVTMAINISGVHFTDKKLVPYILGLLKKLNLTLDSTIIELTESALLSDIDVENNSVRRFTDKGLQLSIDDFGTGFSSLAYLHKIPASIVKIDRSFTQRLEADPSLIKSIHHLIESQGFKTLVEGVETTQQSLILKKMGISLQQGFGLGLPQPLDYYSKH